MSSGRQVPPAPALEEGHRIDFNIFRSSIRLVSATLHIPRLFLAIVAISFFWTIGAVLFIQFPPLVKNVLTADRAVASLFLAIFSVGVAIGSVAINRLLKGEVSARYSTPVGARPWACSSSPSTSVSVTLARHCPTARSTTSATSWTIRAYWPLLGSLLGIAIVGGMFVVPLYAFLTTTVPKCAGGAHGGGQQYRQFGRDGDRLAARRSACRMAGVGDRRPAAARRGDVPRLRLARLEAAQGVRRHPCPDTEGLPPTV